VAISVRVSNSVRLSSTEFQGVAGGGNDWLAYWGGRSDFPPTQPAESIASGRFLSLGTPLASPDFWGRHVPLDRRQRTVTNVTSSNTLTKHS
jgi:hypothetical protein